MEANRAEPIPAARSCQDQAALGAWGSEFFAGSLPTSVAVPAGFVVDGIGTGSGRAFAVSASNRSCWSWASIIRPATLPYTSIVSPMELWPAFSCTSLGWVPASTCSAINVRRTAGPPGDRAVRRVAPSAGRTLGSASALTRADSVPQFFMGGALDRPTAGGSEM